MKQLFVDVIWNEKERSFCYFFLCEFLSVDQKNYYLHGCLF